MLDNPENLYESSVNMLGPTYSHEKNIGAAEYLSPQEYMQVAAEFKTNIFLGSGASIYSRVLVDNYENPSLYSGSAEAQQAITNAENIVREDLGLAGIELPDETSESFISYLRSHNDEVDAEAERRVGELEIYKQEFADIIFAAAEQGGFPLSVEQIRERLSHTDMVFADPIIRGQSLRPSRDEGAIFDQNIQAVFVGLGKDPETTRYFVFHELLHALSGTRITKQDEDGDLPASIEKVGFQHNTKVATKENAYRLGVSYNEGVIDALALALSHGETIDFSAEGDESEDQWLRLYDTVEQFAFTYDAESMASIHLLKNIDAKTVFVSLFKSDFDEHEADRLAGTHADRDLQRQIKIRGGMERIKQMRLIDATLATLQDDNSQEMPEGLARAIQLSEFDADHQTPETLVHNINILNDYRKRRDEGIAKAHKHKLETMIDN